MSNHTHPNANATALPLGTLGIGNGCIDTRVMIPSFPNMAYNNTYGIQVYNESIYETAMNNITAPQTGCYDLIDSCRALAAAGDPTGQGNNDTVNLACQAASEMCFEWIQEAYLTYSDVSPRFPLRGSSASLLLT